MTTRIRIGMIILLLLAGAGRTWSQEYKVVRDLHLWTGVKIEKSFAKDWSVFVAEELRLKHDMSRMNNHLTETGLRYRINKNFALEGQYRVTFDKKQDDSYEQLSRYVLDLRYKGSIDPLSIRYRLRYQKEIEGFRLWDQSLPYEKYLRHRLSIRYEDLGRFKPYVSAELFQLFEPNQEAEYEYIRVLAGLRYKLKGGSLFNLAYGLNREFSGPQPAMIYLLKLNYTFSF